MQAITVVASCILFQHTISVHVWHGNCKLPQLD